MHDRIVALLIALACTAAPAASQIPDRFTNLKVLPETIARDSLIQIMRSFSFALGVRCQYCHVGGDGISFDGVRFADDGDEDKRKARYMLDMVRTINEDLLAALPDRDRPAVSVSCVTCHGGLARPQTMEAVLGETVRTAGADSAVARYRSLRDRYYGTGAYDFSAQVLLEVARRLAAERRFDDATRMLHLNAEFHPEHRPLYIQLAETRLQAADTTAAAAAFNKVLQLDPENAYARRRLTEIRR